MVIRYIDWFKSAVDVYSPMGYLIWWLINEEIESRTFDNDKLLLYVYILCTSKCNLNEQLIIMCRKLSRVEK